MNLRVTTPTTMVLDREVSYVQAEDPSGRFGILPGHERFLTTLVPSVLVYRHSAGESYVAVRNGVLRVTENGVEVAVREAHPSDHLAELEKTIRAARENRDERSYRATRSLYQMQMAAWRRLLEYKDARTR